jgi:hypothetical protein
MEKNPPESSLVGIKILIVSATKVVHKNTDCIIISMQ